MRWIAIGLGCLPLVAHAQDTTTDTGTTVESIDDESAEPSDESTRAQQATTSGEPEERGPSPSHESVESSSTAIALPSELRAAIGCAPIAALDHGDTRVVACRRRVIGWRDGAVAWRLDLPSVIAGLARRPSGRVAALDTLGRTATLCDPEPRMRDEGYRRACEVVVTASDRDALEVRAGPLVDVEPGAVLAFHRHTRHGAVRIASGVVESATIDRARVRVGLGERVPVGTHGTPTERLEHALWTPPRIERLIVRGALDALVPFDDAPGVIVALDAAWHLDAPIVVRAGLAPLALGERSGAGILALLGYASVGLDTDFAEASVGAAATTVNQRSRGQSTVAGAVLLGLRLGAVDGLSLESQFFFLFDDVGVDLGVARGRLTVPLTVGHRLVVRSDVGRHGVVRVDGGLVLFLDGRGDRGSLALGLFVGAAQIAYRAVCPVGTCPQTAALAPTAGVELDWRP